MNSLGDISFFRHGRTSQICAVLPRILTIALIGWWLEPGQVLSQTALRSRAQLFSPEVPFSFPEGLVAGNRGEVYVLDTDLSTLFRVDAQSSKITRLCGPETLSSPSDIAVDSHGNLWVLSGVRSKIFKLTLECHVQTEIVSQRLPLRIAANAFGEIVVLNGAGENLFELYGSDGKLLRAFGKRLDYQDEATNSELSDGCIAPDRSGGFFFSFNYPPLIRYYGRGGNLISEFKPESDIVIAPPNVSVRRLGNSTVVSSRYQILVLDMAVDVKGRLYLLLSGKNKVPALTEGTQKLVILAATGRILKTAVLEYSFHRVAVGNGRLYLLRNRKPMRLDAYALH